jgi:hypothetical protein
MIEIEWFSTCQVPVGIQVINFKTVTTITKPSDLQKNGRLGSGVCAEIARSTDRPPKFQWNHKEIFFQSLIYWVSPGIHYGLSANAVRWHGCPISAKNKKAISARQVRLPSVSFSSTWMKKYKHWLTLSQLLPWRPIVPKREPLHDDYFKKRYVTDNGFVKICDQQLIPQKSDKIAQDGHSCYVSNTRELIDTPDHAVFREISICATDVLFINETRSARSQTIQSVFNKIHWIHHCNSVCIIFLVACLWPAYDRYNFLTMTTKTFLEHRWKVRQSWHLLFQHANLIKLIVIRIYASNLDQTI